MRPNETERFFAGGYLILWLGTALLMLVGLTFNAKLMVLAGVVTMTLSWLVLVVYLAWLFLR